jgi:hypothetical protein
MDLHLGWWIRTLDIEKERVSDQQTMRIKYWDKAQP